GIIQRAHVTPFPEPLRVLLVGAGADPFGAEVGAHQVEGPRQDRGPRPVHSELDQLHCFLPSTAWARRLTRVWRPAASFTAARLRPAGLAVRPTPLPVATARRRRPCRRRRGLRGPRTTPCR